MIRASIPKSAQAEIERYLAKEDSYYFTLPSTLKECYEDDYFDEWDLSSDSTFTITVVECHTDRIISNDAVADFREELEEEGIHIPVTQIAQISAKIKVTGAEGDVYDYFGYYSKDEGVSAHTFYCYQADGKWYYLPDVLD